MTGGVFQSNRDGIGLPELEEKVLLLDHIIGVFLIIAG